MSLLLATGTFAQFSEQKTFDKAVAVVPNVKMAIQNKHGNITIRSWDKDSLVVHAVISGESKSLDRLQTAINRTQINFKNKEDYISISSGTNMSTIDRSINEIKSATGLNDISINYVINVPKGAKLSITNRYGDIYLDDHEGEINLEISHGNLRGGKLRRINYLRSNFGNIYLGSVDKMDGNLLFSDFEVEKAGEINISSKSTSYEIENINKLTINTTNDKINIDRIHTFNIIGNLSKVTIDHLEKSMDAHLDYGRIRVKKVEAETTHLNLLSNRTTFDLTFAASIVFTKSGNCENCELNNYELVTQRAAKKDAKALSFRTNCQKTTFYFR